MIAHLGVFGHLLGTLAQSNFYLSNDALMGSSCQVLSLAEKVWATSVECTQYLWPVLLCQELDMELSLRILETLFT